MKRKIKFKTWSNKTKTFVPPKATKRQLVYSNGQHELIYSAIKVSPDPDAPGLTAYEGVCVLLCKIEAVRNRLVNMQSNNSHTKEAIRVLEMEYKEFHAIPML